MKQRETRGITWPTARLTLELAVVFSVFSQMDAIEQFTRPAMYAAWILVLIMGAAKHQGKLLLKGFMLRFLLAYFLFVGLSLVSGFADRKHLSASYIRVLIVPLLVTLAGDMYADEDPDFWNRIGKLYLICSVIFALWAQKTYFPSYTFWLQSKVYLFSHKNSAAQIWVSAVLVSVLLIEYRSKYEKFLIYLACAYLLFVIGISQCRTAILGIGVSVLAFSITRAQKKGRWILVLAFAVIAAWRIPAFHRFIEQALFLNKYEGADLNTFSSGRLTLYQIAFRKFLSSPIIGVGKHYVDCSYLMILAESGVLGFLLVEWIWVKKIVMCFRYHGEHRRSAFLFMMTVFYLVESLLEGYPPFGPGVSSFMFWLTSSVFLNWSAEKERLEDDSFFSGSTLESFQVQE